MKERSCFGKHIISFGPVRKRGRESESTGFCACWEAMATTSENLAFSAVVVPLQTGLVAYLSPYRAIMMGALL